MARVGLKSHPKFKRLLAMLHIPEAHAYGHLQMLWDVAYELGEDIGDAFDVEINAGWTGESGVLCDALARCAGEGREGFIEPNPDRPGHWRVHDLYDHAPKYVQKRMEREAARLARGVTISEIRRSAAKEMHNRKICMQTDANENHLHPFASKNGANGLQAGANGLTPSPAPSPSPCTSLRDACAEASPAPAEKPSAPVVIELPAVGSGAKAVSVTEDQVSGWREAFPGVDVLAELRKAKAWLEANPSRRKTARGIPAFVVSWLGRAQDRSKPSTATGGRASPSPPASGPRGPAVAALQSQVSTLHFPTIPKARGAPE